MKQKRRNRGILCLFLLCTMLLFAFTVDVYAVSDDLTNEVDEQNDDRFTEGSPWLGNADDSIYSNSVDAAEEEQDIEPDEPGMVEKYLSELIRNAASSLISLLEENLGAGLDKIIYGRVGSGKPNSVNIYGFELRSGNPYGVTASVCYSLVRSMVFVFLGINFVFLLAKSAWTGQTAQSREKLKSAFYLTAMKFAMLTLMPYLFDVALYVRDVVLFGIKEVTGEMITDGATLSLSKAFLINAERTGRFVDAMMYLGTVILTLYFAIIYVALAIDILICFVVFPIMCLMHSSKRDLLGGWIMNILSDILTPVLDAVLLMVPLLTSLMLADVIKGIAIIQMIMCMLIIPSRNRIKSLLGIQSNERGGLLGIMALATLGRAAVGKVKGAFGRIGDIRSDLQKSRMHKDLADAEEEERESLLGGYSQDGRSSGGLLDNGTNEIRPSGEGQAEEMDSSDMDYDDGQSLDSYDDETESLAEPGAEEMAVEEPENDFAEENGVENMEAEPEGVINENTDPDSGTREEEVPESGQSEPAVSGEDMSGSVDAEGDVAEDIPENTISKNEALRNLDRAMEQKQDAIDGLRAQKARYQNEEKQKAREMLDYDKNSDEYRQLEKQRADAAVRVAETDQKIASQMRNMNQLRNQAKAIRGSQTGPTPSSFDEAKADIICKRANINNFEQPEFRNVLSHEQLQKLYRQRAAANIIKGAGSLAGAAAGGVVLGGGSIFMQPSTVAMASAAGALGGAAVGGGMVSAGMVGVQTGAAGIRTARTVISNGRAGMQAQVISAAAGADFDAVYDQAAMAPLPSAAPVPPETPVQRQQRTEQMAGSAGATVSSAGSAASSQEVPGNVEVIQQQVVTEIERDSAGALKKVIAPSGELRTSAALQALERANIETERYLAAVRETRGIQLNQRQEREKRIELQTEYMTEEVLKKLSVQPEYEKGSEKYRVAQEMIREKVRAIVEKQNKDIF